MIYLIGNKELQKERGFTMEYNAMIKKYAELAYTHNYICGFIFNHKLYAIHMNKETIKQVMSFGVGSRNRGKSLRYRPTKALKTIMLTLGACYMGTEKDFMDMVNNSIYNKGEIFEKMVTEKYGQNWEKDSVPFYKGADLTVGNTPYSIKFQEATFCTEQTLSRLA